MRIRHSVAGIENAGNGMVMVTFKEVISNKAMKEYLERAQKDYNSQGFAGNIPIPMLNQIRESRFKNEFRQQFPLAKWELKGLLIGDQVDIDMPLTIDDIVPMNDGFGV